MGNNKKTIIIVIALILVCVLAALIYNKATETDRLRQELMQEIDKDFANYRENDSHIDFYIKDVLMDDAELQNFLIAKIKEICDNREKWLLRYFLFALVDEEYYSITIANAINENLAASLNIDDCLEMVDTINDIEYYGQEITLERNTGIIGSYIDNNGTNTITLTAGEGFYANAEDENSRKTVGLPGSPLYDATKVVHTGDIKCVCYYGVKLNSFYEETKYSREEYYFRDSPISFAPGDGELVWSGDYLFNFSPSGKLIAFSKLGNK